MKIWGEGERLGTEWYYHLACMDARHPNFKLPHLDPSVYTVECRTQDRQEITDIDEEDSKKREKVRCTRYDRVVALLGVREC